MNKDFGLNFQKSYFTFKKSLRPLRPLRLADLLQKIERSDSTLRYSAVLYSIFCGSLFNTVQAIEALVRIQKETTTYGVSYEAAG